MASRSFYRSLNQVNLVGRVTKEPDFKEKDGTKYCRFVVVTEERYYSAKYENKIKKLSAFHQCVSWGRQAEFVRDYIPVGALVSVMGRITYSTYKARDGSTRWSTSIISDVLTVLLFPPKKAGQSDAAEPEPGREPEAEPPEEAVDSMPEGEDNEDKPPF